MGSTVEPMRTVPATAPALLFGDRPDVLEVLRPFGVRVGARVEVDIDAVAITAPEVAEALWAYHLRCAGLWRALRNGRPGGAFVAIRRPLADYVQRNTKTVKTDLVDQLGALGELEGFQQIADALTDPVPDVARLEAMVGAWGGSVVQEPGTVTVTVPVEGSYAFTDALGGLAGFGEVRRVLTLTARQAAWRDRRVRRLSRVLVEAEEIWADPSPSRPDAGAITGLGLARDDAPRPACLPEPAPSGVVTGSAPVRRVTVAPTSAAPGGVPAVGAPMSWLAVALQVLREAECPLRAREILQRAEDAGLVFSAAGCTPTQSLSRDLRAAIARGDSGVTSPERGLFATLPLTA